MISSRIVGENPKQSVQRCSTKVSFLICLSFPPFWCWTLSITGHSTGKYCSMKDFMSTQNINYNPAPSVNPFHAMWGPCQVFLNFVSQRIFGAFPFSEVWCSFFPIPTLQGLLFIALHYCCFKWRWIFGHPSPNLLLCHAALAGVLYEFDLFT